MAKCSSRSLCGPDDQVVGGDVDALAARQFKNFGLATCRDDLAVPPALHRGVILMAEHLGQLPHPPKPADYVSCAHAEILRMMRIGVNVECGPGYMHDAFMPTTGEKLRELLSRAGLKQTQLAKLAGYSQPSGVQRYFDDDYDDPLPMDKAIRFASVMADRGDVRASEVIDLTGILPDHQAFVEMLDVLLDPETFLKGRAEAVQALADMLPEVLSRALAANPPPVVPRGR